MGLNVAKVTPRLVAEKKAIDIVAIAAKHLKNKKILILETLLIFISQ